jgi:hypothetical protein
LGKSDKGANLTYVHFQCACGMVETRPKIRGKYQKCRECKRQSKLATQRRYWAKHKGKGYLRQGRPTDEERRRRWESTGMVGKCPTANQHVSDRDLLGQGLTSPSHRLHLRSGRTC